MITTSYQSSLSGNPIFRIVVDEKVADLRDSSGRKNNLFPTPPTIPVSVYADDKRSRTGIHARGVYIRELSGEGPEQFTGKKFFVPIFRPFFYGRLSLGEVVTYSGSSAMILGLRPELVR